jgi:hypothetical protein
MIFESLFAREVYIRLAEDGGRFICTVRRGRFLSRSAEFRVEGHPILSLERTEELLSTRARPPIPPRLSRLGAPSNPPIAG